MKKIFKKLIQKKAFRILITAALAIIGAISGGVISIFDGQNRVIAIVVCCIATGGNVLLSAVIATIDRNERIAHEEAAKKMDVYRTLFEGLSNEFQNTAEQINKIANDIIKKGTVSGERWTSDGGAQAICTLIFKMVRDLCVDGDDIEIIYTKKLESNNEIQTVAFINDEMECPRCFMKRRNINAPDAYYDAKMFLSGESKAVFKLSSQEVDKSMVYIDREKESGKYEQYLLIPIMCNKNKMVGLLEIFARKGTIIANNKEEMKKIRKLLKIMCSLLLLFQKTEKAFMATPKV